LALQERLRRRLRTERQADDPVSPSEDSALGPVENAARGAIRENLTDPDFGVDDLAAAVSMSRSTLYRKLKAEAGATPSSLLRTVRMETARSLLREGEPATQVAYAVGYASLSSFSRAFAKDAGMTPSEFADATDAGSRSSG
jgi:AraC-like DNA-binding protein